VPPPCTRTPRRPGQKSQKRPCAVFRRSRAPRSGIPTEPMAILARKSIWRDGAADDDPAVDPPIPGPRPLTPTPRGVTNCSPTVPTPAPPDSLSTTRGAWSLP
jgi:hypothetical protein